MYVIRSLQDIFNIYSQVMNEGKSTEEVIKNMKEDLHGMGECFTSECFCFVHDEPEKDYRINYTKGQIDSLACNFFAEVMGRSKNKKGFDKLMKKQFKLLKKKTSKNCLGL